MKIPTTYEELHAYALSDLDFVWEQHGLVLVIVSGVSFGPAVPLLNVRVLADEGRRKLHRYPVRLECGRVLYSEGD